MGFIADLLIRIGADTTDLKKELSSARRDLQSWGRDLEGIGQKLTLGMTVPLLGVATAALKVSGELEQNSVAFKTLLGSADLAQKHLNDLKDFALKTPFQFTELTIASKRMQALGFAAKDVIPNLTNIGDAASALGLGAEGLNRIVTALGQMKAKGSVQAEEMRQLAEAGIPAWEILAKTLNTDVAGAMKLVEQRAVSAGTAVPALLAGMNAKFGGLMAEQSKTLLGQWSNFKDAITFTLQDVGKVLAPMAKNIMETFMMPLLGGLKDLAAGFAALPPGLQNATVGVLSFLAAIGPVGLALGVTAKGMADFAGIAMKLPALLNPITLALAALATGAGLAWYELGKSTAPLHALDQAFEAMIAKLVKGTYDFEGARAKLAASLEAGTLGLSSYNQALAILEQREKEAYGAEMAKSFAARGVAIKIAADATKQLTTDTEALNVLNIRSTAERVKSLADARAAYAVLAKNHAENSQVMAEATLRVKQAEEALYGTQEQNNAKRKQFPAFASMSLANAIAVEEENRAYARQREIIAGIVDFRMNMFKTVWHSIMPTDPLQGLPDLKGVLDTAQVDRTETSMAKLIATSMQLPPELKLMKEDLQAFDLGGESIDTLGDRLARLKKLQDEGAISLDTTTGLC